MVLSLAFIISFIASAVFLFVGILIFSDVVEAMALTLPVITGDTTPPTLTQIDLTASQWSFRNQEASATAVDVCSIEGNSNIDQAINDGVADISNNNIAFTGKCLIFKTFNITDVSNKDLIITWSGTCITTSCGTFSIGVVDQFYNRNNNTHFPQLGGGSFGFDSAKGNGLLQSFQVTGVGAGLQFNTTDTLSIGSLSGASGSQVTLAVTAVNTATNSYIDMRLFEIEVEDAGIWNFQGLGTPTDYDAEPASQQFERGFFNMNFTDTFIPATFTESEQQQVDTFNTARNIGFTVVGIMPVALFFILFSIFSSRLE